MKRVALKMAVILLALAPAVALAQVPIGPTPRGGPDGGGPNGTAGQGPRRQDDGPPDGPDRPDGPPGEGQRRGPGGSGPDQGPPDGRRTNELRADHVTLTLSNMDLPPEMRVLHGYLTTVESFVQLNEDAAASGVAAVLGAADLLKAKGPEAGIDFFTKALTDAKNETVQRAIRFQLIDLYKRAHQDDKAMEQLRMLIVAAPAGPAPHEHNGDREGGDRPGSDARPPAPR